MKLLSSIREEEWTKSKLSEVLIPESEKFSQELRNKKDMGYLLWPLRVSLTGKKASAGPFEIGEILGKKKTLERLKWAKGLLK